MVSFKINPTVELELMVDTNIQNYIYFIVLVTGWFSTISFVVVVVVVPVVMREVGLFIYIFVVKRFFCKLTQLENLETLIKNKTD